MSNNKKQKLIIYNRMRNNGYTLIDKNNIDWYLNNCSLEMWKYWEKNYIEYYEIENYKY